MVKQLITNLTIYSLALFYGLIVSIGVVWRLIRNFGVMRGAGRRDTPPSCLLDPDLGEHHFLRTASNVKFHYVAKGDITKPLILCLHGFPEFWYSWRYQLKAFSDQFRVVAVDLRGYGESDHPQESSQYKLSFLVNDIKEIVMALGYKSCILFCHDWGGFLGWYVAHLYPDIVDKLIACNIPHPRCFRRTIWTSRKQFLMSWYIFFFQLPYLPEFLIQMDDFKRLEGIFKKVKNCTDEDVEGYKYAFTQSGFTGPINYYRNALFSDLPRGLCATKIKAPTLVVWGTEDIALHKDTLQGTEKYVRDLTIKFIEGASHWIQMDEPQKVNQYIHDFLTVHTGGSLQKPD